MLHLKVLFFASCREAVGVNEIECTVSSGASIADLLDHLCEKHPPLARLRGFLQIAVNEEYREHEALLQDGDEVALIPPVSGGGQHDILQVVTEPIAADALHEQVRSPADGAVVTFSGVVRNHSGEQATTHLVYEAYPPMAERMMAILAAETRQRWPVGQIGILHRVGRLEIGEISVLISVASGHRLEAFEACQHLIDRLKEVVPIWKKEVGPGGEFWVEGPRIAEVEESAG